MTRDVTGDVPGHPGLRLSAGGVREDTQGIRPGRDAGGDPGGETSPRASRSRVTTRAWDVTRTCAGTGRRGYGGTSAVMPLSSPVAIQTPEVSYWDAGIVRRSYVSHPTGLSVDVSHPSRRSSQLRWDGVGVTHERASQRE